MNMKDTARAFFPQDDPDMSLQRRKEEHYEAELLKIDPAALRVYLVNCGWEARGNMKDGSELFVNREGFMLQLPMQVGKWPYLNLLKDLINELSVIEERWYPHLVFYLQEISEK